MSAGERDMSDTGIWRPCGHSWLDCACYAVGGLDEEMEARAVEVQAVTCAACSDELGDHLEVAGLIYEAVDVARCQFGGVRCRGLSHRVDGATPAAALAHTARREVQRLQRFGTQLCIRDWAAVLAISNSAEVASVDSPLRA
jgi:hypothetical protein